MQINVFRIPSQTVRNSVSVFRLFSIVILAVGIFSANKSYGQALSDGSYVGLEDMSSISPDKPKIKWYQLTHLTIKGDSVWVNQSPISIYKRDTVWSASDGGFYNYKGKITVNEGQLVIDLKMTHCDYCPVPGDTSRYEKFSHKVMRGQITENGMKIEGHLYIKTKSNDVDFIIFIPAKSRVLFGFVDLSLL